MKPAIGAAVDLRCESAVMGFWSCGDPAPSPVEDYEDLDDPGGTAGPARS